MIKIIEEGQKTFTRTCNRCGCKFQYDLSDLSGTDYIDCPCCHTTLVHVGPKAIKIDLNKSTSTDSDEYLEDIRKYTITTPYKIDVGDGRYNYATTTGEYINPNIATTISASDIDPNVTIYANKLPNDVVDDPYNKIGSDFPDGVRDDCMYRSAAYEDYYNHWKKQVEENKPIKCKKK